MLDHFTILTQGGLVLWSRSFTPSRSPLDALIREALIEQRATTSSPSLNISRFDKDQSTLLYSFENSLPLSLVFVVSYQRILNLSYPNELLEKSKKSFVKTQREEVEKLKDDMTRGMRIRPGQIGFEWKGWDQSFDKLLKELEGQEAIKKRSSKPRASSAALVSPNTIDTSNETTPSETPNPETTGESPDAQTIARNIAALKARQKAAARSSKGGKKGGASGTDTDSNAGSESDASPAKPKRPAKSATKWADSSLSAADLAAYDYSSAHDPATGSSSQEIDTTNMISKEALGKRDESGMYEVADYAVKNGGDDDSSDSEGEQEDGQSKPSSTSTFSSFFSRLSLSSSSSSSKTLTKADLAPILQQMQSHLTAKNVASPIAAKLIESIGLSLEGKPVDSTSWTRGGGIRKQVRLALTDSLTKVLTPKTSTDLLLEITRKRSQAVSTGSSITTRSGTTIGNAGGPDPYAIAFVGVNGVGKSTNLSKVAFWLLQNKMRVLIAACDTFRSGAVEQLRVHVRNLGKLEEALEIGGEVEKGKGKVELFEKGYGKDAAGIAKDALAYAKSNGFDVVLIDSAGRQQDNEPLMRALAKLVSVNQPDKVIFVGEALVGNEAVDQLTKFDRSLKDFSSSGALNNSSKGGAGGERKQARGIDGMILTKFDTIDDKVGAALSMTYTTGQPIYFVGCGQTYSDLRMLRVNHIVQALLQD